MSKELVVVSPTSTRTPAILNNSSKVLAIRQGKNYQADYVPHLGLDDVRRMADLAAQHRRNGERDSLLLLTLFDGCFRVSEAISMRPEDIKNVNGGWMVSILGKGHKRGTAAISASLAAKLQSYAYRAKLPADNAIFPVSRSRVFQIIQSLMTEARINKPDGVGSVHILRHSGALERLKQTCNPKAVQEQLRHIDTTPFTCYILKLPMQQFGRIMRWHIRNVKILSRTLRG